MSILLQRLLLVWLSPRNLCAPGAELFRPLISDKKPEVAQLPSIFLLALIKTRPWRMLMTPGL